MLTNFGSAQKFSKTTASAKKKNVQVVVRTRPMSENERSSKNKNIVVCDSVSKIVNLKTAQNDRHNHNQGQRTFGPFDKVFGPETTQIHIYNEVVTPLMKEVINGYNCTVFAYGQTGSGKTYTMEGRHDESGEYSWDSDPTSGIIPRALHQIFTELGSGTDDIDFTVRASYVELYNENIYDLLSMSETSQFESLRIFDDKTKGVSIAGAEEVVVRTRDEVYELLKRGADKRRTAATLMNISSSRSHSVFTVSVMIRESGLVNGEELLRQGKLNLVDLAGSENIGRSGATDKRAREAGNINTSLLALGRVINALTMSAPHIPYRESKLTRILQDSLGGKTITTIIATISPASSNFEESVNTLDYAQRAKNIKNNPEVNQKITRRGLLKEYNDEIERLRRDLLAAREKHGIYLDKENYDTMLETIEEKSTKVGELENQLSGQLHRVKILIEDFDIMDAHYQSVYEKCCAALNKLEKRKVQVEKLNKDLAQTNDNLKAANKALSLSENSFVRLRAQAYKFQTSCIDYYQDLGVLYGKLDSMSQVFADNEELLEKLLMDQSARIERARAQLTAFSVSSSALLDQELVLNGQIAGQTKNHTDRSMTSFASIDKNFAQIVELFTNCREICAKQKIETENNSEVVEKLTGSVQSSVVDQKVSVDLVMQQMSTVLDESAKQIEEVRQEFKRIRATGSTPNRRETTSFLEELVDLAPAQKLFEEQRQLVTPRRTSNYRTRDSILDSSAFGSALVSPNTLKDNLPGKKMEMNLESVEEEKSSSLQGSSSLRNSKKSDGNKP